jgi:hypothetical protein
MGGITMANLFIIACVLVTCHGCHSYEEKCETKTLTSGTCSISIKGCACVSVAEKDLKYKADATETTSGKSSGDTPWYKHSEEAGDNALLILFNKALIHTEPETTPLQKDYCNCQHKDQKIGICTIRATVCAMFNSTDAVAAKTVGTIHAHRMPFFEI